MLNKEIKKSSLVTNEKGGGDDIFKIVKTKQKLLELTKSLQGSVNNLASL